MESEIQEVKTLTKELAEKYFKARFSVDLATFHYLEDEAAKIISKKENSCGLQLDGLCELSEKSAVFLARHVDTISLNGLLKISDSVAQILARHKGPNLFLNGLTSLSKSSAEALGKYRGQGLSLNGLANLSESSAEALGKFRNALSLQGLTEITENQAKSLAKKTSDLNLSGLKTISDEVAVALSKHKGGLLELNSLLTLSDKACENLVKHLGPLSFTGVAELSDAAFDMLKSFADSGTTLYLSSPYFQRFKDYKSGSSDSDDVHKEPDESLR